MNEERYIDAFSHLYDKWKRLFDGFSEKEHLIIHPLHNFIQFDAWNSKSSASHFLWRFRRFWLFIDRIYIILFFPQGLREDCHPSSRVAAAVISSWSRRRPYRFHLPPGTREGKGERSNLYGGPAPPHSPRAGNTADYTTTSVDEDGVLNALRHFGLVWKRKIILSMFWCLSPWLGETDPKGTAGHQRFGKKCHLDRTEFWWGCNCQDYLGLRKWRCCKACFLFFLDILVPYLYFCSRNVLSCR